MANLGVHGGGLADVIHTPELGRVMPVAERYDEDAVRRMMRGKLARRFKARRGREGTWQE
jgi:hypothetical protein